VKPKVEGQGFDTLIKFNYEETAEDFALGLDAESDPLAAQMRHKMSKLKSKMKDAKTIKELTTPISADISMINGSNNYDQVIPSLSNILNDQDFASVSSIGGKTPPTHPHPHPPNPDDLFLDTSYIAPAHIKIDPSGYLKQLAQGGPCDRVYPITSLGQNSMDFMRDFMKNFIVDPFYK
jgi:hypothetical protein